MPGATRQHAPTHGPRSKHPGSIHGHILLPYCGGASHATPRRWLKELLSSCTWAAHFPVWCLLCVLVGCSGDSGCASVPGVGCTPAADASGAVADYLLRNGCTAFLVGPCHVVTVAHCVYDPVRDIWWPGLEFSAGRNGRSAWAPYGTVTWRATEVPEGWRRGGGAGAAGSERYDYALVVLAAPLGRQLGWMGIGGCGDGAAEANGGLPVRAAAVQVAGYPDDRENGTLWFESCNIQLPPQQQRNSTGGSGGGGRGGPALLYHDCHTRGGNSGSPLWLTRPQSSQPCVVAMHVAGEQVRRWDAAGHLYGSRSRGVAVNLEGEAGAWLRSALAKHNDC